MAIEVTVENPNILSSRLWSLKNSEEYCDAIVVVNGKSISVHKAVLASASKYFDNFFKTTSQNVVTFQNVDGDALELLLKYCYWGTIKITLDNANEILTLARILSLNEILDQSLKIFETTYSFESCHSIWKIDQMGVVEKQCGKRTCITEKISSADNLNTDDESKKTSSVQLKSAESTSDEKVDKNDCNSFAADDSLVVHDHNPEFNLSSLQIYDEIKNEWTVVYIHYEYKSFYSVFLDDKIFFIGGRDSHKKDVNEVAYYDLKSGILEVCPPMKYHRQNVRAVQCDSLIFALGGKSEILKFIFPSVERYDPEVKKWTEVSPMNITREDFAVEVLNHSIYVVGGNGKDGEALSSTEVYSVVGDRWESFAPLLEARYNLGLTAFRGCLYAVGGKNRKSAVGSIEVYDPDIDKWTMLEQSVNILKGYNYITYAINFMDKIIIGNELRTEIFDPIANTSEPMTENKSVWGSVNFLRIPRKLAEDLISRKRS